MKNKRALDIAECLIVNYIDFTRKRFNKLGDLTFDSIYGSWDTQTYLDLRNLLFNLVTGEDCFERFYDRFDAPGTTKGEKPVAWGPRFLPDMINDDIWDVSLTLEDKITRIEKNYNKCLKLEKSFNKKQVKGKK